MNLANPHRVDYGDAVIERLGNETSTPQLKSDLAAFKKRHAAFVSAHQAALKAEKAYDKALDAVTLADKKRDGTILEIADHLPAVGLGSRKNPFAGLSQRTPNDMVRLPHAAETEAVDELIEALGKAKTSPTIEGLCKRLSSENGAVTAALKALDAPRTALNQARAARDLLVPDWDKSLGHVRDTAKVALRDAAGHWKSAFAPLAAVTTAKPARRAKTAPTAEPTNAAAPSGDGAAAPKKTKRSARRK